MADKRGQTSVVYMGFFVLLGVIFLGFVFTFSSDFKDNSAEEISTYFADNVFARIEKASIELHAVENQTSCGNLTKTISIPRRLGESTYQIFGKGGSVILTSSGKIYVYEVKSIYWPNMLFEGSADSQNSELRLHLNTTTSTIRFS